MGQLVTNIRLHPRFRIGCLCLLTCLVSFLFTDEKGKFLILFSAPKPVAFFGSMEIDAEVVALEANIEVIAVLASVSDAFDPAL